LNFIKLLLNSKGNAESLAYIAKKMAELPSIIKDPQSTEIRLELNKILSAVESVSRKEIKLPKDLINLPGDVKENQRVLQNQYSSIVTAIDDFRNMEPKTIVEKRYLQNIIRPTEIVSGPPDQTYNDILAELRAMKMGQTEGKKAELSVMDRNRLDNLIRDVSQLVAKPPQVITKETIRELPAKIIKEDSDQYIAILTKLDELIRAEPKVIKEIGRTTIEPTRYVPTAETEFKYRELLSKLSNLETKMSNYETSLRTDSTTDFYLKQILNEVSQLKGVPESQIRSIVDRVSSQIKTTVPEPRREPSAKLREMLLGRAQPTPAAPAPIDTSALTRDVVKAITPQLKAQQNELLMAMNEKNQDEIDRNVEMENTATYNGLLGTLRTMKDEILVNVRDEVKKSTATPVVNRDRLSLLEKEQKSLSDLLSSKLETNSRAMLEKMTNLIEKRDNENKYALDKMYVDINKKIDLSDAEAERRYLKYLDETTSMKAKINNEKELRAKEYEYLNKELLSREMMTQEKLDAIAKNQAETNLRIEKVGTLIDDEGDRSAQAQEMIYLDLQRISRELVEALRTNERFLYELSKSPEKPMEIDLPMSTDNDSETYFNFVSSLFPGSTSFARMNIVDKLLQLPPYMREQAVAYLYNQWESLFSESRSKMFPGAPSVSSTPEVSARLGYSAPAAVSYPEGAPAVAYPNRAAIDYTAPTKEPFGRTDPPGPPPGAAAVTVGPTPTTSSIVSDCCPEDCLMDEELKQRAIDDMRAKRIAPKSMGPYPGDEYAYLPSKQILLTGITSKNVDYNLQDTTLRYTKDIEKQIVTEFANPSLTADTAGSSKLDLRASKMSNKLLSNAKKLALAKDRGLHYASTIESVATDISSVAPASDDKNVNNTKEEARIKTPIVQNNTMPLKPSMAETPSYLSGEAFKSAITETGALVDMIQEAAKNPKKMKEFMLKMILPKWKGMQPKMKQTLETAQITGPAQDLLYNVQFIINSLQAVNSIDMMNKKPLSISPDLFEINIRDDQFKSTVSPTSPTEEFVDAPTVPLGMDEESVTATMEDMYRTDEDFAYFMDEPDISNKIDVTKAYIDSFLVEMETRRISPEEASQKMKIVNRMIDVVAQPPKAPMFADLLEEQDWIDMNMADQKDIQELLDERNKLTPLFKSYGRGIDKKNGSGVHSMQCKKCKNKNREELYDVDDKEIMCKKCSGSGMYSSRQRIASGAKMTPLRQHAKYGGIIRKFEENAMKKQEEEMTDFDRFEKSYQKSGGKLEKQLLSRYMAYGKPNQHLLDQTAYAMGLATHKYDMNNQLPPMLLANIYGGLSKFAKGVSSSKYIDMSRLDDHASIKDYILNDSTSLLKNIVDL
jgi:hypothetical protein